MFRDPNFYLALAGLAIGVIGVYLAWRYHYTGKITYMREGLISLFNDVVRSMPELAVTYEGQPIQANFVILRGHLFNAGRKDFTLDMIEQPLSFDLPAGFKWRKVSITSTSKELKANSEIVADTSLRFNFGLFRCKEHISFEALAEVPHIMESKDSPATRLNKAIRINHRIADTKSVDTIVMPTNPKEIKPWKKTSIWQFIGFIVVAFTIYFISNFFMDKPAEFVYTINNNNESVQVEIQPKANGDIFIKSLDGRIRYTQKSEEFFQDKGWTAKAVPKKLSFWTYLKYMSAFLVLFGFIAAGDIIEYRRAVKLYRLLKQTDSDDKLK